jgi:uncharacterized membrane protein
MFVLALPFGDAVVAATVAFIPRVAFGLTPYQGY